MFRTLALVLVLVASSSVFAIPESGFPSLLESKVAPFYAAGFAGSFRGQAGARIVYRVFAHPKAVGSIVISEGYGENLHKYEEVAYDLFNQGYSVFLFDHRGQGYSDRLLSDPRKGYVDDHEYFIKDLKQFFETVVKQKAAGPYFLLGHSMGGAISARYLEIYPGDFKAAVLSAPMLQIKLGYPEIAVRLELEIYKLTSYVGGKKGSPAATDPATRSFENNGVTNSRTRFQYLSQEILSNEPTLGLWGTTAHWVSESLTLSDQARLRASRVKTPLLLFQAGQDALVVPDGQNRFCENAKPFCTKIVFPNSGHEILMELDSTRDEAINRIVAFFNQN